MERHPHPFARVGACAAGRSVALSCGRSPIRSSLRSRRGPETECTMSREDPKIETWPSDAQLAQCARADTVPFPSPIPTQIVSNGAARVPPRLGQPLEDAPALPRRGRNA